MDTGGRRSIWRAGLLTPLPVLLGGCLCDRGQIGQALRAYRPPPAQVHQVAARYRAHCPDLVRIYIAALPRCSGSYHIGPDGRIELGEFGRVQIEGETTPEIARTVAESAGVPTDQVQVSVAEYDSQYLYLFGPTSGSQRVVPYQGPETVLDLLQRVGGLPEGAALRDITIVRPHVAEGKTPEVFHIDLAAILLRKDVETNIPLEPFDQIHIAPASGASYRDCLPPWLQKWFRG